MIKSVRILFTLIFLFSMSWNLFSQQAELLVQLGHSDRVHQIDYSQDEKYLLTAGSDKMIKLWQTNNGLLLRTFKGHKGAIYDAKLSLDAKFIFSCSWDDKCLFKWDISNGKILKKYINSKQPITKLSLSPDGKFLAGLCENAIIIFKEIDLTLVKKIPVTEPAQLQYSEDGKLLYIATKDYSKEKFLTYDITKSAFTESMVSIYSPESMKIAKGILLLSNYKEWACFNLSTKTRTFYKEKDSLRITSSALSNAGNLVAIAYENGSISLSSLNGELSSLEKKHSAMINALRFSKNDEFLATASNDWTSKIYSLRSGKVVKEFKTKSEFIQGISLNSTGNHLAFASGNLETGNHIGVWNITKGKLFPYYSNAAVNDFFTSVAFSPKNKTVAAGNSNGNIHYYGFPNGNSGYLNIGSLSVTAVAFTPNGKNIISGTKDGQLIFWRPDRNKNESILADKEGIASLAINSNSSKIAAGTFDGKLLIYNYDDKSLQTTIQSHTMAAGYSDTTFNLAYGSVTGMNLEDGFVMKYASVMGVAFSQDNATVATCGGSWIKVFDVKTGELIRQITQTGAGFCSVNFSANGQWLCAAGADFMVRLYEVNTGKLLNTFSGHQNEVRTVLFSSNQKYLISGSFDTQIKIWDIALGKEVLSYIVLQGGIDYVITNPQGYYFATKGASKVLSFRVGNAVFPFEQFDLKYNRPDIILNEISKFVYGDTKDHPNSNLIKSYYAAYQKRLKRSGFSETQLGLDFHVPVVQLNTSKIPLSTKDENLNFEIKADDDLYSLSYIHVWVNDVPAFGAKGIAVSGKHYLQNCNLKLSNERNKITVSCINEKGVESFKETFETIYEGGKMNYKVWFIGIGVSNYLDTGFNLKYAVKDVEDIAKSVKEKYPEAKITLLTNSEVTKERILILKNELLNTGVNDKVIISLSGHGLLSTDLDFYYATYNMDFEHPEKNGLLYEDLQGILDGIPARNKLIMVDACHSGEVDKTETIEFADTVLSAGVTGTTSKGAKVIVNKKSVGLENSFELMQELFSDMSKGNGAVVISAAGGKEYALESARWNNGVFTYSVLNGLKNNAADANKDGQVSVNELKNYVSTEVQKLTSGSQKPTSRRENLENDWVIWTD
jgi:WD40 repeat protein